MNQMLLESIIISPSITYLLICWFYGTLFSGLKLKLKELGTRSIEWKALVDLVECPICLSFYISLLVTTLITLPWIFVRLFYIKFEVFWTWETVRFIFESIIFWLIQVLVSAGCGCLWFKIYQVKETQYTYYQLRIEELYRKLQNQENVISK